jgi:5-formyltetrahydrofolate cyclo-ligase
MLTQLQTTKSTLRKQTLLLREQLPVEKRVAHNAMVTENLLNLPEYQQAETVLGYMNFGSEYASELWIAQVLADGKRLVLPRVNRHTNHLDLYLIEDLDTQLAAGLWNIREPVIQRCERLIDINEVEFVLVPGIAFSRDGARLGYGGGFYDKLLAPLKAEGKRLLPALVAAGFALQIVNQIPQEETDVKVQWLVTEKETVNCSAQGNR